MDDGQTQPERAPLDAGGWWPWRFFLHALGGVFTLRALGLAALGVCASLLVTWALAALIVGGETGLLDEPAPQPAAESALVASPLELFLTALSGPVRHWWSVVGPFRGALVYEAQAKERLTLLAIGLARLSVWSVFGAALARVAARHVTLRTPPTFTGALRGVLANRLSLIAPPLVLLAIAGALLLPLALHAWLLGMPWLNVLAAATLPVAILFALAAAVIAVGLALAWPLTWASLAVERPDPFDAVSTAYAYVTQRPVRLAVYVLVALLVAAPVGVLVEIATAGALLVTTGVLGAEPADAAGTYLAAWRIADFWTTLLGALPRVFYATYFWFAAVALYLLLRRDVDETQADELFEEDEPPAPSAPPTPA